MDWSAEAEQLLREVPFFVRPAVRHRIASMAAEAGREQVDAAFYQQARARFGRPGSGDAVKE
ncbi:MAG: PCP reductase family protein [Cyanobium sp.]